MDVQLRKTKARMKRRFIDNLIFLILFIIIAIVALLKSLLQL
jgi:hypothetical protein